MPNVAWDNVDGWFGAGVNVGFTVYDAAMNTKGGGAGTADGTGWLNGVYCGCDMVPGDTVHVTSGGGLDETITLIEITGVVNVVANTVSGHFAGLTSGEGYVEISSLSGPGAWKEITIGADGSYTADFTGAYDLIIGDQANVWYMDDNDTNPGNAFYSVEVVWLDVEVNSSHIWGFAPEGPIVITTPTEQRTLPAGGHFDERLDNPFAPGDAVTVAAGAATLPVAFTVPDPFTGSIDHEAGDVAGTIGAPDGKQVEVALWDLPGQWVTIGGGAYLADFGAGLPRFQEGDVNYPALEDFARISFHLHIRTQAVLLRVNYAHDWVEFEYAPGHDVTLTLKDALGVVKATSQGQTGPIPWWNGVTGYTTNLSGWSNGQPDIVAGDQVFVSLDNGETADVKVGEITGALDFVANTAAGTIGVPGATGALNGRCEVQQENGPQPVPFTFDPTAGGAYSCDFNTVGWDLKSLHDVAVFYTDDDGDQVINVLREPYARVNTAWDSVDGLFSPSATIYVTVRDSGGTVKGTGQSMAGSNGWGGTGCNCDIVPGDTVEVTTNAGFSATIEALEITGTTDLAADTVSGQISGDPGLFPSDGVVEVWSPARQEGFGWPLPIAADGSFDVDLHDRFDIQPGDESTVWYVYPDGNQSGNTFYTVQIPRVDLDVYRTRIWGYAPKDPSRSPTAAMCG